MCGISGSISRNSDEVTNVGAMINAIKHRGPDGQQVQLVYGGDYSTTFGHARLSVQDLSNAGTQPMQSNSSRYTIVFNGEIYNHLDLRKELEAEAASVSWLGHSDTETLLAGFEHWGISTTLKKLHGMFAIALWDHDTLQLTLARDRMGEKPLYFGWLDSSFVFASELSAIRAHSDFNGSIDRSALCELLRHNYIPAPLTVFDGIMKLEPATMMTISPDSKNITSELYWDFNATIENGIKARGESGTASQLDDKQFLASTKSVLLESVERQLLSDVPLGCFLSGGIDSSLITALMCEVSSSSVNTFTIGFKENDFNEADYALKVSKHLGTKHHTAMLTGEDALAVVPDLANIYSEPFADPSALPTALLAKTTRQSVTVALSGDGADELFMGYERYEFTQKVWDKIRKVPSPVRKLIQGATRGLSAASLEKIVSKSSVALPRLGNMAPSADRILKGAELLNAGTFRELYYKLDAHWYDPADIILGSSDPRSLKARGDGFNWIEDNDDWMCAYDSTAYLPDDILVKVDRAAMAYSLETRAPFLDHQVVEHAWRLPETMKKRDGQQKWILKQLLREYIPNDLIDKPKMGFGIPLHLWLRGPLKDWAEDLLSESALARHGVFNVAKIREIWRQHSDGERNWAYRLWTVLMLCQWLESVR